jgi:hypothetical protein
MGFQRREPSSQRARRHLAAFRDNRRARLACYHRVHRPGHLEPSCPAAAGYPRLHNPAAGCRQSIPEEDCHPSNRQADCHLRTPEAGCRSSRRSASCPHREPYPEEMRPQEDHPLLRRWLHSDSYREADCRPCIPEEDCRRRPWSGPEAGCHWSRRSASYLRREPCPEETRPQEDHPLCHPEGSRPARRTKPAELRRLQHLRQDRLQRPLRDHQKQPELQREHRPAPHLAEDRTTAAVREHSTPPDRLRRPTVHLSRRSRSSRRQKH